MNSYDPDFQNAVANLQDALAKFEQCLVSRLSPSKHLRVLPPSEAEHGTKRRGRPHESANM